MLSARHMEIHGDRTVARDRAGVKAAWKGPRHADSSYTRRGRGRENSTHAHNWATTPSRMAMSASRRVQPTLRPPRQSATGLRAAIRQLLSAVLWLPPTACRVSNLPAGSAPTRPPCAARCSCRRACGIGHSAYPAHDKACRRASWRHSAAPRLPCPVPAASRAHGVRRQFSPPPRPVMPPVLTAPVTTVCPPLTSTCCTTTTCLPPRRIFSSVVMPS